MAVNPYSSVSISGYNSSPPPDDGSQTSANKVEWQKHKSKLTDPLKTLIESVNTNALAAFNDLALQTAFISTTTATIAEADWGELYLQLATGRINYPDPSTLENGWHHTVYNGSTGIVQLQATATNFWTTVNGLASEFLLRPGHSVKPMNSATTWLPVGQIIRAGEVMQFQYQFTATICTTGTGTTPFDSTIPVATEGTQHLTLSVSPNKIGNVVEVEALVWCSPQSASNIQASMFLGTASNAITAGSRWITATDEYGSIPIHYWATATSLSPMSFAVRIGAHGGAHVLNGNSSGFILGGAAISYIKAIEYNV